MDKKDLRKTISRMRDLLTPEERTAYSQIIQDHVLGMELYQYAHTVTYFVSFRSEVDTIPMIKAGLGIGKAGSLPITDLKNGQLRFSELGIFEQELSLSTYGILEPKPEWIRPVPAEEIDFILTPGLVFDRLGYRIGYGGGFYDRFLGSMERKPPTVAVAYELQVLNEPLPREEFDIPVDWIVTENGLIHCTGQRHDEQLGI